MTSYDTALAAVRNLRMTLTIDLPKAEEAIRRRAAAKGASGAIFSELVNEYSVAFETLASECIDRAAWLTAHSLRPAWWWVKRWMKDSTSELDLLHTDCHNRLNSIRERYAMNNHAMAMHLSRELEGAKVRAGARIELRLRSLKNEATTASARKAISWVQRGLLFLLGWAAHALAQWLHMPVP